MKSRRRIEPVAGISVPKFKIGLIHILLIPLFMLCMQSHAFVDEGDTVKINVFSKYLRLIKEGSSGGLNIFLGKGAILYDNMSGNSLYADSVSVYFKNDRWRVEAAGRVISAPFNIKIENGGNSTFRIKIGAGVRDYPLPLEIKGKEEPAFYVYENLDRYSIDSSSAELGSCSVDLHEAVAAQALLIKARYKNRIKRHADSDFCDLTHCQVYEGRKNCGIESGQWNIDTDKLKGELLFHSSCGGHTFDQRVFGKSVGYPGITDRLYRQGISLCSKKNDTWERSLSLEDMNEIYFNEPGLFYNDFTIVYDKKNLRVNIRCGLGEKSYAPESLRLLLNRKRGWNYIKSNNYEVISPDRAWKLKGTGLGHGSGLCQHGSMSLSRLGYSRYEILNHYFQQIQFKPVSSDAYTPNISYMIFDIKSGSIIQTTNKGMTGRFITAGSVFKLVTALYIAMERPDLAESYTFDCGGSKYHDTAMPERCWKPGGHGKVNLEEALSASCNLYFASLYKKIDRDKYKAFMDRMKRELSLRFEYPPLDPDKRFADVLSGLDSGISFYGSDLVKLVQIYYTTGTDKQDIEIFKARIPDTLRLKFNVSLMNTFISGTGSGKTKPFGDEINYSYLVRNESNIEKAEGMWGKTSTMLDGTTGPQAYGLFIGARGDTGIVTMLRGGNGHLASKWATVILASYTNQEPL